MRQSLSVGYKEISEKTQRIAELEAQTAKAKELLKQWQQANICDSVVLFLDTEQFLKEIE